MTTLVRLTKKDPAAWALVPQVSARIRQFALEAGQQNGDELALRVEAAFVTEHPSPAVWVVVEDSRVLAHLFAVDDYWNGEKIGLVVQLSGDPAAISAVHRETALFELDAWSRSLGHAALMMVTQRWNLRAWRRLFGFEPYRLLMRRRL